MERFCGEKPLPASVTETYEIAIDIGGVPVRLRTDSAEFQRMMSERYAGFLGSPDACVFDLRIELATPGTVDPDADVSVRLESGRWIMERGDFYAEWGLERRQGW